MLFSFKKCGEWIRENHRKSNSSKRPHQSGQVSIFIALIFQILFLFFAAVINIGLLVHHKINLQNSVDLAAYYGAMKQAEMLNAIGHVNYQIRQSWKLLSWRYRALGTAGDFREHPFSKTVPLYKPSSPGIELLDDVPNQPQRHDDQTYPRNNFYNRPAFCITFIPFKPMPPDENTCKNMSESHSDVITLFKPTPIIAPFVGITTVLQAAALASLSNIRERAKVFGTFNYLTLGRFYLNFINDVTAKKLTISGMANGLSESDNNFTDIDGDSVAMGVEKTLGNNLTFANRETVQFKFYNSLGKDSSDCGKSGNSYGLPNWLKEITVYPAFRYADTKLGFSGGSDIIVTESRSLFNTATNTSNLPQHYLETPANYKELVEAIRPFMGIMSSPREPSMGFEKNPNCVAYVGVTATSKPKIPFSPIVGVIELKASALAKPFGGRIGPWYQSKWDGQVTGDSGSGSNLNLRVDKLAPPRLQNNSIDPNDPSPFMNYSRFPGDTAGLKSAKVLFQYGKSVYRIGGLVARPDLTSPEQQLAAADEPNFNYWPESLDLFKQGSANDPLSWNPNLGWEDGKKSNMRWLEISAIAPDLFDITHYSIEPDFYNNYFKRMENGFFKKKPPTDTANFALRRDFGSRINDPKVGNKLNDFGIKDQLKAMEEFSKDTNAFVDVQNSLTYITKNIGNVLTSWMSTNLIGEDFENPLSSANAPNFGHCGDNQGTDDNNAIVKPTEFAAPGSCTGKFQGRTGYSVKIQSLQGFPENEMANKIYLEKMRTDLGI